MILHVAGLNNFTFPFVRLVQEDFIDQKHHFWLSGSDEKYPVESTDSIFVCKDGFWNKILSYGRLILQLHRAQKVIVHGLFNPRLVIIFACCPWLLGKFYWLIWGNDLYQFNTSERGFKFRFKEFFRRFVIRRIGHLVTYVDGDVDLARKWYGANGIHHKCIMYLSNVVNPSIFEIRQKKQFDSRSLNILLGNSADPSNNHIEALQRLLPYKNQDIIIFAPLSYGDQRHAQKVINIGQEWFGKKFVPMTEFMPFDEYVEVLGNVDIAIFNHQRQQAMGNTITLLGMGKTVFMRSDVSQWRFLTDLGIHLGDVANLTLQRIGNAEAKQNSRIVQSYFSKTTLINQLSDIFEG